MGTRQGSRPMWFLLGILSNRHTGRLKSLSEQQLVDCDTSSDGCQGGYMNRAVQYGASHAMCSESSYPYKARDGRCASSSCTTAIPRGGISGVKTVQQST